MNKLIFLLFITGCLGPILSGLVWLLKSDQVERLWEARQEVALTRWMDQFSGRERFIKTQKLLLWILIGVVILVWLCLMGLIATDSLPPTESGHSAQIRRE